MESNQEMEERLFREQQQQHLPNPPMPVKNLPPTPPTPTHQTPQSTHPKPKPHSSSINSPNTPTQPNTTPPHQHPTKSPWSLRLQGLAYRHQHVEFCQPRAVRSSPCPEGNGNTNCTPRHCGPRSTQTGGRRLSGLQIWLHPPRIGLCSIAMLRTQTGCIQ